MNVTIVAVGKLRERYIREGCDEYLKRLAPYAGVEIIEVRSAQGASARASEGRDILARVADGASLWALDRVGVALSSTDLAREVSGLERSGVRRLVLAIGGADGLDASVCERADLRWSLSPLTFLHEMTRLIVLEQLYRAAKINRGEPYHR
jgi:23S rRNA (pseudouridine1915-N3)-methyltransferase